ncbi:MAG: leucine-rich repeat protein [Lachnospiraceae bacterium]|nr:leucine-rich repeat protein [Lachnospiraceae bacterium]
MKTKNMIKRIIIVLLTVSMVCPNIVMAEPINELSEEPSVSEDYIVLEDDAAVYEEEEVSGEDETDVPDDDSTEDVDSEKDMEPDEVATDTDYAAGDEVSDGTYKGVINGYNTDTVTITGLVGNKIPVNAYIPRSIAGKRVTYIGSCAFKDSKLKGTLTIPDSVLGIEGEAFLGCKGLTGNLVIPDGVKTIENEAFRGCSGFTGNLKIPDTVTKIDYMAFMDCTGFNGKLTIGNGITDIASDTFSGCSGLCGELVIPNNVTKIRSSAFYMCTGFTGDLTIPDSVTQIGGGAFFGCSGFNGNLKISNNVKKIEHSVFCRCEGLKGELIIPEGVTSIGSQAFGSCSGFTGRLKIPDGVIKIGDTAFAFCSGFTGNIEIPDGVTEIGPQAFFECLGFTDNIIMSPNVRVIDRRALENVSNIKGLYLTKGTTSIIADSFKSCNSLKDVYYEGSEQEWKAVIVGDDVIKKATIHFNCKKPDRWTTVSCKVSGKEANVLNEQFVLFNTDTFDLKCEVNSNSNIATYALYSENNLIASVADGEFSGLKAEKFTPEGRVSIVLTDTNGNKSSEKTLLLTIKDHVVICDGELRHSGGDGGGIGMIDFVADEANFLQISNPLEASDSEDYYYNHDIARYACGLATMAYSEDESSIRKSFRDLGYNANRVFYNKDYDQDKATFWIAQKVIHDNTNLVTVVIRGTDGGEWYDNFEPGRNDLHTGFERGCNFVYEKLSDYFNTYRLSDRPVRILVTGHSRGAAVANLLGHKLNTEGINGVDLGPDTLSVYTYASPNVSRLSASPKERNIFNIVNPEDFVTKVMPSAWGYKRYGVTRVLPSLSNSDEIIYGNYLRKIRDIWPKYWDYSGKGSKSQKNYHPYKSGMMDVSNYIQFVSLAVRNVNEYYYKPLKNLYPYHTLYLLYMTTLAEYMGGSKRIGTFFFGLAAIAYGIVGKKTVVFFWDQEKINENFSYGHYPETYLASMKVISEEELKRPKIAWYNIVNCPVDITVYDKDGNNIAKIEDNEVISTSDEVAASVEGDSKRFIIPPGSDYKVELTGNDSGTMDYTVMEMDCDTCTGTRVYYHDVSLGKGRKYVQDTAGATETTDLELKDDNGNTVDRTDIMTVDEQGRLSVDVTIEGIGNAVSLSNLSPGDYANLVASTDTNNSFLGWYDEAGKLLSKETEYGFSVNENRKLIAKFTNVVVEAESISFEEDSISARIGNYISTEPIILPENATYKDVTYTSSDQSIVEVKDSGLLKAVGKGVATVTGTLSNGKSAKYRVLVEIENEGNVPVTGVSLNADSKTIKTGESFVLTATVSPEDASNKSVFWNSGNTDIATVSTTGVVKGILEGATEITVTTEDGKKTAKCSVTVTKNETSPDSPESDEIVLITRIKLSPKNKILKKGKSVTLRAEITPSNATNKGLMWTSSDKKIAKVNSKGKVTAVAPGTAKITATAEDGSGKKTSATIKVKGIALNGKKLTVQKGKTSKTIKATVISDSIKSVKSNNEKVATVKLKGKKLQIKGKETGKASITVKAKSGMKAILKVTVQKDKVTTKTLKLSKYTVKLDGKGKTTTVKVTATPDRLSTNEKIKVTNNKKSVASFKINQNTGEITITAKKKGTCKLTVKVGKKTKKITVKVTK